MSEPAGISFPFRFVNGRVAVSSGVQHIKESVMQVLGTAKGEYLMRPTFGSDLFRRVFQPTNVVALAEGDVREALRVWEQRVKVNSVSSSVDESELGVVRLGVDFTVKDLGQSAQTEQTIRR